MSFPLYAADALLAVIAFILIHRIIHRFSPPTTLPPCPQPKPLIGNLLDVPTGRSWIAWAEHAIKFGPLSRLSVFGTNIIVLHDPRAAAALFEKRSAVFSDRPRMVFGGEMCGWENTLALQRYGEAFRLFRRELHQILGTPAAIARFHPLIEIETRRFLLRVLNDPSKLQKHVHTSAGAIILRMAYGYTIEPSGRDPLHTLADKGIQQISMAAQPGAFIVDVLPFLRHLPTWFPGARTFHATAKHFKETVTELVEKPYAFVKTQITNGTAEASYVSSLLEKYDKEGNGMVTAEQEYIIKWSASSLYTGGSDTTVSAIQAFFLAMLLHPHILERAQAEVDSVTGGRRLPGFADRENLPYLNAVCKEVLRWAPVAPMGLPHVNSEDIVYDGYTLPKSSIVMPNIWHYSHDPSVYDSPYEFRPERFLQGSCPPSPIGSFPRHAATLCAERDVREYVFGFGRRACPGRELADASLFMFVTMSIAALDIRPPAASAIDLGKINVAEGLGWVAGTITHPEPFSVDARPRSSAAESLIKSVEMEHPWDKNDAECIMHVDWKMTSLESSTSLPFDSTSLNKEHGHVILSFSTIYIFSRVQSPSLSFAMASIAAALASFVSTSADSLARSLQPVDPDSFQSNTLANLLHLIQECADNIGYVAVHGQPFQISDIPAIIDALNTFRGFKLDDRKMLLEKLLVFMSRLPPDSKLAKVLHDLAIDVLYKDLPHPPAAYLPSKPGAQTYQSTNPSAYANGQANGHAKDDTIGHGVSIANDVPRYAARSVDGKGYSTFYRNMGAAREPYARSVPSTHPLGNLPDAGLVFDTLLARRPSSKSSHPSYKIQSVLPSSDPRAKPGHATLPPTSASGFAPQPGGLSSLFFAFANLIIHSIFNTDHENWSQNNVSSYLDLNPLYGSNDEDLRRVRRFDGSGKLWEDVFADVRVRFMPPSAPALLVLFCRNHNYIASKLLAINEFGTYTSDIDGMDEESRKTQDEDLFSRARLVNCGWFTQAILKDYVGAILGLVREGCEWRLDPLADSRKPDHTVSPRGQGNVVSVEFNLLYRWHPALSERDTSFTESIFERLFGTRDWKSITMEDFEKKISKKYNSSVDSDVKEWTFLGVDNKELKRNSNGSFANADLAALLQAATESPAGAFKAQGIPEVLRVVEIMGIEQARQWGTATMNEFRKFMELKPFSSFSEWNSDPEITSAAKSLYGNIDNLELYPGLLAEEVKPPIPGAGLCPGYTISRAILSDAVALTRGDRFLTTDFTVYNLTSWGYLDCFPQKDDGAFGGILTRLLYRTLPDCYPVRSSYARFPFMVPKKIQEFLGKLVQSPVSKYDFSKPRLPAPEVVIGDYKSVKAILDNAKGFKSGVNDNLVSLTGDTRLDVHSVDDALDLFILENNRSTHLEDITESLIAVNSSANGGLAYNTRRIDIVRDVINLVPVYFVARELLGLPIKTKETPHGLYHDVEYKNMFAHICDYVYLNREGYVDWVLREKGSKTNGLITGVLSGHIKRLAGTGLIGKIVDSVVQRYTGEDKLSDAFLSRVLHAKTNSKHMAESIFAAVVPSIALYSKAVAHIIHYFLEAGQENVRQEIVRLAHINSVESDKTLYAYAREALRLNPPVSSTAREDILGEFGLPGRKVCLSIIEANLDQATFGGDPTSVDIDRPVKGLLGFDNHGLTSDKFLEATIPRVLRAIFKLKNLQRAPDASGTLRRIVETEGGYPEVGYLNERGELGPFPASMVVQYEL